MIQTATARPRGRSGESIHQTRLVRKQSHLSERDAACHTPCFRPLPRPAVAVGYEVLR